MGKETLYNKKSKSELEKDLKNETFSRQTLSFYKYMKLDDLDILRDKIYKSFNTLRILGRIYIASEGINAQISIPQKNIKRFEKLLDVDFNFGSIFIKKAVKEGSSFYKLIVKIKNEIVAYNISNKEYNMKKIGKYLYISNIKFTMKGYPDKIVVL